MNRQPVCAGPWRRWRALQAERRSDREWSRAMATAATPSQRNELVVLRSIAGGARSPDRAPQRIRAGWHLR